ncbi:MAG TPA: V-type ATPase 116kDa subunit family protein [Nitrososphaerales archaeon]|nr:V-type ATPase 116kDa subunit family protein [Nitrososphaerales archaeon]
MGLAKLSSVTIISPRSEYADVAKALALFEDFHPVQDGIPNFDPAVQELAVKAVRLFALADQAAKDLDLELLPGTIDVVFRGVKVPRNQFEAATWDELLTKAETDLTPIVEEIKAAKERLQRATKAEMDARTTMDTLQSVSALSADLGRVSELSLLKIVLSVVKNEAVDEFRNSVPGAIFLVQKLSDENSITLVAVQKLEEGKVDKAMKSLDLKPLLIPAGLPQNPAEAYERLKKDHESAKNERETAEAKMVEVRDRQKTALLSARELTEVARNMLDEARVSGGLTRLATISGYIPTKRENEFRNLFGSWMVHVEPATDAEHNGGVPTLLENPPGVSIFQLITGQQGIPGKHEVDPTPLISFVFPIFFGMMFADLGHGIVITLVALLVRQRGKGSLRQWGNIFLAAGVSAMFFGAVFGEFFGVLLSPLIRNPFTFEIVKDGGVDTGAIEQVMIVAILIGVAHLTTGLGLDVYEALKENLRTEVLVGKIPTLSMYLSGVGYGVAFIGAGYNFNVLAAPKFNPVPGLPNQLLGGVSLTILLVSMVVLLCGKAVALKMGKLHGESVGAALADGGLEVFERISQFLSNTISYVRLAIMLLVHAVLLLIVNQYTPVTNPLTVIPWVVLNCLIIAFEAFVVYVQDLRLHIYEFFTKFYRGTGTPFRKILPDRVRVDIKWR